MTTSSIDLYLPVRFAGRRNTAQAINTTNRAERGVRTT
jgi:hypothetical protein